MNHKYQGLHNSMLDDVARLWLQAEKSERDIIENCFECCTDYWHKLSSWIKADPFTNEAEEIEFFKDVKPQFAGYIEYFIQRYHAKLFLPAKDEKEMLKNWEAELKRIDKFFFANEDLYKYLYSGKTDKDREYFVRSEHEGIVSRIKVYDMDLQTSTEHDYALAGIVAFGMYRKYVEDEIKKLGV